MNQWMWAAAKSWRRKKKIEDILETSERNEICWHLEFLNLTWWDLCQTNDPQNCKIINLCCFVLCAQSCPTLCDPMDCSLPGSSVYGNFPRENIGVGCHALLQGIFPTQRPNPGLPHCRQSLYCLSQQGSLVQAIGRSIVGGELENLTIRINQPKVNQHFINT